MRMKKKEGEEYKRVKKTNKRQRVKYKMRTVKEKKSLMGQKTNQTRIAPTMTHVGEENKENQTQDEDEKEEGERV